MDAERLEESFQDLGFEIRRYDDVTCVKMTSLLHEGELGELYRGKINFTNTCFLNVCVLVNLLLDTLTLHFGSGPLFGPT